MSEANARQVGGLHYGLSEFQHWDMVEQYQMGYLEGCATKYIARWRLKRDISDLDKADHYVQKLIEIGRQPRGHVPPDVINQFCEQGGIDIVSLEAKCLRILCYGWRHSEDLEAVRWLLAALKRLQEICEAPEDFSGS